MFCRRPIFTHARAAPDGWKTGTKVDEVPGAWFSAASVIHHLPISFMQRLEANTQAVSSEHR